jgi:hypothetical protein
MMAARITLVVALVCMVFGGVVRAEQNMQVTPLARDGRLLVTFRLSDAFNEDIGPHLAGSDHLRHDVELRPWHVPLARSNDRPGDGVGHRRDNLTRRNVTRREDGRLERADTVDREMSP